MIAIKWILGLVIILLTGCSSIGPRQVYLDRNRYNEITQNTTNQQLLANIVKLRYVEPTAFLKLVNITASYTLAETTGSQTAAGVVYTTGIEAKAHLSTVQRTLNLNPQLNYSDTPTITYSPVDSAEFVQSLMTPIDLRSFQLLFSGGIDEPGTLLRLIVSNINELDNASAASSAKMPGLPRYEAYYNFLNILVPMVQNGQFELATTKTSDGQYALVVYFRDPYVNSPEAIKIKKILNVPLNSKSIIFSQNYDLHTKDRNIVHLRTRSIYGIMTYLSYGVRIPEPDIKAKYVYQYRYPNGQLFDWSLLLRGLITICAADFEPMDAFVKVFTHNHWFYIKNSDLNSKATFTLLTRLITLTAGNKLGGGGPGPVLTLPAGR